MEDAASWAKRWNLDSLLSADLLAAMRVRRHEAGELIIRAGSPVRHLMFFVEGRAKVYASMENGTRVLASFATPFEVLGDVELFSLETYTLDVEALAPSTCLVLPAKAIRKAAPRNAPLLMYLCGRLGRKARDFNVAAAVNLRYPVENRLASWLLAVNTEEGGAGATDDLGELADILGASYRQLARVVRHFRALGILDTERGRIRVLDRAALAPFARDLYR